MLGGVAEEDVEVVEVAAGSADDDYSPGFHRAGAYAASEDGTRDTSAVRPETLYARSGDVSIAYQVVGDGPFDIIFVPAFLSNVDVAWTVPFAARMRERLAAFSRLIPFDKRGTGMSDRVTDAPTLETRMDDVRAVMDAAGSSRAALFGASEGAPMSLLFAATYPERTAALVLWGGYAREMWAPDYPWGTTEEAYRESMDGEQRMFGPREDAEAMLRQSSLGIEDVGTYLDYYRSSTSPGALEALSLMNKQIDVRHVLSAIHVPTLIVHGTDDTAVPVEGARYMAQRIAGSRLVELAGAGHQYIGDTALALTDEVQRFLTGVWESGGWDAVEPDRVLATVLFTDIVDSSQRLAAMGDRAWRELLERHHEVVRRELQRFRGQEVDTAGDGFFASFDGPARAIGCASAIVDAVKELGIEVRAGLHTGECEVVDGKVAGIAVHTGARVASTPTRGRCSCRARSRISSPALASRSPTAARTS